MRSSTIIACFVVFFCTLNACSSPKSTADTGLPKTDVVFGFSKGTMSGSCALGIGPSGGRKITTVLDLATSWRADEKSAVYKTIKLSPGEWDLYQIQCGHFAIDRPAGPRGFTPRSGTFRALANFTVGPQSPIYLGNVELKSAGDNGWQYFAIRIDTQAARDHLAAQQINSERPMELSPIRHVKPDPPGAVRQGVTLAVFNPAFGWRLRPRRVRAGSLLQGAGPEVLFPNRFQRPRVLSEHIPQPLKRPNRGHSRPR